MEDETREHRLRRNGIQVLITQYVFASQTKCDLYLFTRMAFSSSSFPFSHSFLTVLLLVILATSSFYSLRFFVINCITYKKRVFNT